jgi:hypothetical protein
VGASEPGEVGRAILSHVARTAGAGEDQGSQEAAFANHGETLCRWASVGLAVGSRSSEVVGDQGGTRRWEMVEVDIRRSLHGAECEDPGSHLADGDKWVGIRGLDAAVVVDGA